MIRFIRFRSEIPCVSGWSHRQVARLRPFDGSRGWYEVLASSRSHDGGPCGRTKGRSEEIRQVRLVPIHKTVKMAHTRQSKSDSGTYKTVKARFWHV